MDQIVLMFHYKDEYLTYVSGENFSIGLSNPNINLGANYFTLYESASTNESYIGVEAFSTSPLQLTDFLIMVFIYRQLIRMNLLFLK